MPILIPILQGLRLLDSLPMERLRDVSRQMNEIRVERRQVVVKSGEVSVTTKNGLVTLSGVVSSKAQVQKSIAVAKAVKGVRQVDASALSSRD